MIALKARSDARGVILPGVIRARSPLPGTGMYRLEFGSEEGLCVGDLTTL